MAEYTLKATWQEFSITAEELAEAELEGALERVWQARLPLFISLGLDPRKCRQLLIDTLNDARKQGKWYVRLIQENWLAEAKRLEKERGWP